MDDRELLELAAKAVGVPVMGFSEDGAVERSDGGWWNPLNDVCECIEIAHDLGFEVIFTEQGVNVCQIGEMVLLAAEPIALYPHLSFMRAIVRAAAEIGKVANE